MKIETQYPFDNYNGYIVINKENRKHLCLINKINKKERTTISYARYLMSIKEKRILNKNEQVDHIDGNKTNDIIENLQILSKKENNIKKYIETNKTLKMISLQCPNCNKIFDIRMGNSFLVKKGYYNTCSKNCNYEILKRKFTIEELKNIGINQIIKIYRK